MSDLAKKKIDDHVGRQIRKRRNLLGLTQEQLADALGISYQQVQKYETAANRVSAGRLYEIAAKLDSDIGFFFEDLDPSLLGSTPSQVPSPIRQSSHVLIPCLQHYLSQWN